MLLHRRALGCSLNYSIGTGAGSLALINAMEITGSDSGVPAEFGVNWSFTDNGQSWSTIATNLLSNRFGEGQFHWTANAATEGHTGIFRATAVGSGLANISHTSTRGTSVTAATNSFYVNTAGDMDFTDNEYTTAAGNDLGSGTSPASPLAESARPVAELYVLGRRYYLC